MHSKCIYLCRKFVVQTDHRALEWLEKLKENIASTLLLCGGTSTRGYELELERTFKKSSNCLAAREGEGSNFRAQTYGYELSIRIIEFLSIRIGRNRCINVICVGFEKVGYAYFQIKVSNWLI